MERDLHVLLHQLTNLSGHGRDTLENKVCKPGKITTGNNSPQDKKNGWADKSLRKPREGPRTDGMASTSAASREEALQERIRDLERQLARAAKSGRG
jgi:hypothetical protein